MTVLAVDLAAKYSAAVLMDYRAKVRCQFDSWYEPTEGWFATLLGRQMGKIDRVGNYPCPDVMVIEDLPHRLLFSSLVKHVCRLQGRIVQNVQNAHRDIHESILFVAPSEWRKIYPDLHKRGSGPEMVVPVAANLGYEPPDLSEMAAKVKGGKAIARKVATDYCAAFLIAYWAYEKKREHGSYHDIPGTMRYGEIPTRKNVRGAAQKKDDDGQG